MNATKMYLFFASEDEYLQMLEVLNEKQQVFHLEILKYERQRLSGCSQTRLFPFLTGSAGTRKSVLIKCLYQTLIRLFRNHSDTVTSPTVCLAAYTALAAKNIVGTTLHSLLGLSFNTDVARGRCISASTLSTYRVKLRQVRVLMIDEISFVGARLFNCIDELLRLIMDVDNFFGGITVICIGDLLQLEPVQDSCIFEVPKGQYTAVTETPWRNFCLFELDKVMRQSEKS